MQTDDPTRRAPGAGFTRTDKAGNKTWYGKWGTGPL